MATKARGPRARTSTRPPTKSKARRRVARAVTARAATYNVRLDGKNRSLLRTFAYSTPATAQAQAAPLVIEPPTIDPNALATPPSSGEPDNLILSSYRDKPIDILWGGFGSAFSGDVITFLFQGTEFDRIVVGDSDVPPYIGSLPGPHNEGFYTLMVHYEGAGGAGDYSAPIPIQFDFTPPGNAGVLAALLFDPADDIEGTGITRAKLRDDGTGRLYLWAEVPSYSGRAEDDLVHIFCNGEEDSRVGKANVIGDHIEVQISEAFLDRVGDTPQASFTYQLEDRAGNLSRPSLPVTVALQLRGIATLQPPAVPAYDDDPTDPLIDEADARGTGGVGFVIAVPWNDEFVSGDQLVVSLDGESAGLVPVGPTGEVTNIPFPYPGSLAVWLAGSSGNDSRVAADVTYTVYRGSASLGTSPPHAVELNLYAKAIDPDPLDPVNQRLQAPTVRSASGMLDEIPVDDFGDDATILIEKVTDDTYPPQGDAFEEGDTLLVYYGTQPPIRFVVTGFGDDADPVEVPLGGDVIEAEGSGDSIPVWYEVEHELADGGTNRNLSPTKSIVVRGTDTQPGRGHLDAGSFPDQNAQGFIPEKPYHYSSTRFLIPNYENRDASDAIAINVELYYGDTDQPGEVPYDPAKYGGRETISAGLDSPIVFNVPASWFNIYGNPDGLVARVHLHATYTVTQKTGDTTPVTSDVATVKVDGRFSSGAATSGA
ncbi:hypothetical protein [Luteibacter sp.]|uniref:hypothetical protein n=1 Tax=Luteibacter sp. TaxID=1886636 RepID=UPI003F81C94B